MYAIYFWKNWFGYQLDELGHYSNRASVSNDKDSSILHTVAL